MTPDPGPATTAQIGSDPEVEHCHVNPPANHVDCDSRLANRQFLRLQGEPGGGTLASPLARSSWRPRCIAHQNASPSSGDLHRGVPHTSGRLWFRTRYVHFVLSEQRHPWPDHGASPFPRARRRPGVMRLRHSPPRAAMPCLVARPPVPRATRQRRLRFAPIALALPICRACSRPRTSPSLRSRRSSSSPRTHALTSVSRALPRLGAAARPA